MNNILDYLETTADKTGWRTGICDEQICMSWNDMIDLSRRIGTAFLKRTLPGRPIAILMEKSTVTLAAMFGAVYAGCYYTVIDPSLPAGRIREILLMFSPEIILVESEKTMWKYMNLSEGETLFLKECLHENSNMDALAGIRKATGPDDLLYCRFPSESTETLQVITVSHRIMIDYISYFVNTFDIREQEVIGNLCPLDMENAVLDIYSCAFTGATLVLIPQRLHKSWTGLLDYICEKHISTLIWYSSALASISSVGGFRYRVPTDIKKIIFCGEEMTTMQQLRIWQEALPETEIINLYRPTDIPTDCAFYRNDEELKGREEIQSGRQNVCN